MHTSPPHDISAGELEALISARGQKELECREYLGSAKDLLGRDTVTEFVYTDTELRTNMGDSDYVISGLVADEGGVEYVAAYVWELKAPQSYLFREDNRNRLIPTPDLFEAENQLFNYFHTLQSSPDFRAEFGVQRREHVRFGGIIIGSDQRLVSGRIADDRKKRLYERALMIRRKFMYDHLNIRVMTWDRILEHLREPHPQVKADEKIEEAIEAKTDAARNIKIESS